MPNNRFNFVPVEAKHQNMILAWLDKPHVTQWFHGVGLKNTIQGLEKFIHNDEPTTDLWIGYLEGVPFAYLITTPITYEDVQAPGDPLARWIEPNQKVICLDLLIGEETYLGKGLATPMIKTFLQEKFADVDVVFIDPEATNTKAIHVYEKAGFEKIDDFIASWHPVPHVLMRLSQSENS